MFLVFSSEVIIVTADVVVACCRVVAFSRVGVVVDNVAESVSFVTTSTRTCVTFSFEGSPPSRAVICKMYSFLTCNGRSNRTVPVLRSIANVSDSGMAFVTSSRKYDTSPLLP